jgi:hypothetical protein
MDTASLLEGLRLRGWSYFVRPVKLLAIAMDSCRALAKSKHDSQDARDQLRTHTQVRLCPVAYHLARFGKRGGHAAHRLERGVDAGLLRLVLNGAPTLHSTARARGYRDAICRGDAGFRAMGRGNLARSCGKRCALVLLRLAEAQEGHSVGRRPNCGDGESGRPTIYLSGSFKRQAAL